MKSLIIDIGTHKAEELRLLSGDRPYILGAYIKWWIDWLKRIVKKIIRRKGLIEYGSGGYMLSPMCVDFKIHLKYIWQIVKPKNYLSDLKVVAIDPVPHITSRYINKIFRKVDIIFLPVAILPHNDNDRCKMSRFYISANSLSSSLYEGKDIKKISVCPAFNFKFIIESLQSLDIVVPGSNVTLRMNCEGSELGVLKGALDCDVKIKNIIGSIGDVQKKHGSVAAKEMAEMLKRNHIRFDYFKGSDPSTWTAGFGSIENV